MRMLISAFLLASLVYTCQCAPPKLYYDGRPHSYSTDYFKEVRYRHSPTVYADDYVLEGESIKNILDLRAMRFIDKRNAKSREMVVYIIVQRREGATDDTNQGYTIQASRAIATRLQDVLRIGRIWRDEGAGEAKERTFSPAVGFSISIWRQEDDATVWWSVSNGKSTFSSTKLTDLSVFTREFGTYLAWLESL